jgi:hypothetical protein
MQAVIDEVFAGPAPLSAIEDAYSVISRIVRTPNDAAARKVQRPMDDASKLLLAAGFHHRSGRPTSPLMALLGKSVMKPERRDSPGRRHTPDKQPVLPAGELQFHGGFETLLPAMQCLRVALRTAWFPPSQPPSLPMRLGKLPQAELVSLLAAAAVRDSLVLASVEAALAKLPAPPWPTVPFLAVGIVASKAQGLTALRWFAVCRNFRAAQLPVRAVVIGAELDRLENEKLRSLVPDGLIVCLRVNPYARCPIEYDSHRIVESISDRHGGELTHLILACALKVPGYALRAKPHVPHGSQLRALRSLDIRQPGMGCDFDDEQGASLSSKCSQSALGQGSLASSGTVALITHSNALAQCSGDLIRTVAAHGMLRELKLAMRIRFELRDLLPLIPLVGLTLEHLEVDLRPPRGQAQLRLLDRMRFSWDDELLLQSVVGAHCTTLRSLAIRR